MKVGTVSLWLPLLLSEKPMYGYELIRELEKRFSGYWLASLDLLLAKCCRY